VQLLHELGGGFVDAAVIRDHALREILHLLRMTFGLRELAGVDVDLIRSDDDGGDLRISGSGTLRPRCGGAEGNNEQRTKVGRGFHLGVSC
jgi:hypothetical protein